jgi:predicted DNA-binding ribbon-helix-helix protein
MMGSLERRAPMRADHRKHGSAVRSLIVKRSVAVSNHKTSVSLEEAFWKALKEIANVHNITVSDLITLIDNERRLGNLSSSIRLFVLDFYRTPAQTPGTSARSQGCTGAGLSDFEKD